MRDSLNAKYFIEASPPLPPWDFIISSFTPCIVHAMAGNVINSCVARTGMDRYSKGGYRAVGLGRPIEYWPISDLPLGSSTWDLKFTEKFKSPEIFLHS